MQITLTPAYGRDYRSKAEAQKALLEGKDFILQCFGHPYDSKPCTGRDLTGQTVKVRYGGLRKVFCITL